MDNYDINKSTDVISYMKEYAMSNPNRKWICEHYHRERISQEQGIKENRPKEEEFYEYEIPAPLFMRGYGHNYIHNEEPKMMIHYDIKTSNLVPISDKECQCSKCGKIFGIKKMEQMEQIFQKMDKLYDQGICCLTSLEFLKMWKGLEPVWYRKNPDGSTQILGVEEDVRKWTLGDREDNYDIPDKYAKKDVLVQLPELKINFDKEAKGCSHFTGEPCVIINAESSSKQLRVIGEVEAALTTDSKGICKCKECGKVFSAEEQQQLHDLVSYLNTTHYWVEEDMKYHD